ncbi:hypothetical protein PIB30_104858 [Stylosanthes scabra]|uniref:Uncharacterized protein n=1 Tax=Stylosanthes scabra TaxID=79078 RepID=A0ABU6TYT0_9FABA|nr:hypothetical protein [Stylosanthes scabra]
MNNNMHGWGLYQVEYNSDSGSDSYHSCEENIIPHHINYAERHQGSSIDKFLRVLMQESSEIKEAQRKTEIQLELITKLTTHLLEHLTNLFSLPHEEGMYAVTLRSSRQLEKSSMQERSEIKEAQRKTEIQLELMTKLTTHLVEHLTNLSSLPHEEGMHAVTLRSGRQLEKSSMSKRQIAPNIPENVKDPAMEEEIHDLQKTTTSEATKRTVEEGRATSLPYPVTARRRRKVKTINPRIVELLRKVEVTLPLLEVIRQVPEFTKFLKEI